MKARMSKQDDMHFVFQNPLPISSSVIKTQPSLLFDDDALIVGKRRNTTGIHNTQ